MLYLLIGTGIGLALFQFFLNRSIWKDEGYIGHNIFTRNYAELLQPLDYIQVAPIGFLYVEKFMTDLFGKYDLVLSIYPLLAFLAAIPVMYQFSKKATGDRFLALFATAAFSILYQLVDMSSEVKQYISDVFFACLIAYASLSLPLRTYRGVVLYLLLGAVAVWFSNVAVILLTTFGLYQIYRWFRGELDLKISLAFGGWLLSFGFYYLKFLKDHPSKVVQQEYWSKLQAFFPLDGSPAEVYAFLLRLLEKLFGTILSFGPFWPMALLITLLSAIYFYRKGNYRIFYFALFPVLIHLTLSALKVYPVEDRLMLYTAPFFVLLFSIGFTSGFFQINRLLPTNLRLPSLLLPLGLLILFTPYFLYYPIRKTEVKQSLLRIEAQIQEGEAVFVDPSAGPVVDYYLVSDESALREMGAQYRFTESVDSLPRRFWYVMATLNDRALAIGATYERPFLDLFQGADYRLLDRGRFEGSAYFYFERVEGVQ